MNLTRYRVTTAPTANFDRGVRAHVAVPIDPHGTEEKGVGWCERGDELNLNPAWNHSGNVALDMRVEMLKVPTKELKRLVRQNTSLNKREAKEFLHGDLRRKIPSKIKAIPMIWDLGRKMVYFGSQSSGDTEAFLGLFANTFAAVLEVDTWGPDEGFLTWLFYAVVNEQVTATLDDKIRLGLGMGKMIVESDFEQARRAVGEGYTVRELPIWLTVGDKTWGVVLDMAQQYHSVKLPAILADNQEEVTEELALLEQLDGLVRSLWDRYQKRDAGLAARVKEWASAAKGPRQLPRRRGPQPRTPMSLSPADVKKQITDPRKFVESLGYSGDIVTEGRGIKVRCPNHEDGGRPNLQISLRGDTLGVHCFVCQFGGDVYHYAEKFLGVDWKEAHARLQKLAGDAPVIARDKDDYPPPDEVCRG